jgi:hypothetical protein
MSSEQKTEPTPPEPAASPPKRERPPVPVLLRDLPLPPEVVPHLDAYCRRYRLRKPKERQEVEEELKLQYYFGGDYVLVLETREGGQVVAAGDVGSEEFGAQFESLSPTVRREAYWWAPPVWGDETASLGLG